MIRRFRSVGLCLAVAALAGCSDSGLGPDGTPSPVAIRVYVDTDASGTFTASLGEFGEAIALYKRSLAVEPTAEAHTFLGWTYSMMNRYDEAIEACHQALQIDSQNLAILFNLSLAYEHLHDYESALRWTRQGLSISPSDPSLQKLEFRIKALQLRDRILDAIRTFLHLRLPHRR